LGSLVITLLNEPSLSDNQDASNEAQPVYEASDGGAPEPKKTSSWFIFLVFLRLGLTSFGGPVAHIGYFRDEFVERRKWFTDQAYAQLVALCQFLPGPSSSQVGMGIGLSRAGYSGCLAAWLGFTLPSALLMILIGLGHGLLNQSLAYGLLSGIKLVVVAVVAHALWGMAKSLCPDNSRATVAALVAAFLLSVGGNLGVWGQLLAVIVAGLAGWGFKLGPIPPSGSHPPLNGPIPAAASQSLKEDALWASDPRSAQLNRHAGLFWLFLFVFLLSGLPVLNWWTDGGFFVALADAYFRAGAMVFGGGHVVLPVLQSQVVEPGWVSNETFLLGYGAVQAMPGPLFTFAGFLGAASSVPTALIDVFSSPWAMALLGLFTLTFIFLPSFLLLAAALPFWHTLQQKPALQSAFYGVNAAVVGLLFAAFYDPVLVTAVTWSLDLAVAILFFVALVFWRLPVWLIVAAGGIVGVLLL
jgi:chromate transporter